MCANDIRLFFHLVTNIYFFIYNMCSFFYCCIGPSNASSAQFTGSHLPLRFILCLKDFSASTSNAHSPTSTQGRDTCYYMAGKWWTRAVIGTITSSTAIKCWWTPELWCSRPLMQALCRTTKSSNSVLRTACCLSHNVAAVI